MMTRDYVFLSLLWGGLGSSGIAGVAAYLVFFKAPDLYGASVYLLLAIFMVVSSCLGVIAYREWRERQFDRWVGMNSPRWTPPTWKNPPGAFDLGFLIRQSDADGLWEAELHGLSQILPGRRELGWIQGLGEFQGEAIANLWLAIYVAQTGDAVLAVKGAKGKDKAPTGSRWGPTWRSRTIVPQGDNDAPATDA